MDISFDPAKNARNVDVHGIAFDRVADFDWTGSVIFEDTRREYGERRYRAFGFIDERLHVLIFTPRDSRNHIISLRKANRREIRTYDTQIRSKEDTDRS